MNPERWQQVTQILDVALALDPRSEFPSSIRPVPAMLNCGAKWNRSVLITRRAPASQHPGGDLKDRRMPVSQPRRPQDWRL